MTTLLLVGLLACASAAPYYDHQQSHQAYYQHQQNYQQYNQYHQNQQSYHQYHQHHQNQQVYGQHHNQQMYGQRQFNHQQFYPYQHHQHNHYPEFNNHNDDRNSVKSLDSDIIQMKKTWNELKKAMTERRVTIPYEGEIENNMYKLVIFLPGFAHNEISVNSETGLLVIQAEHRTQWGIMKSYWDIRILPEFVDTDGAWVYERCWLTIILPLANKSEEKPVTTEVSVTKSQPEYTTVVATTETEKNVTDGEDSGDEVIRGDQGEQNIVTPAEVSPGEQPVETTTRGIPEPTEY